MSQDREYHRAVMADEVVEMFRPIDEGVVVDATYGGGGHTELLKRELGKNVTIVAIDRDPDAARNIPAAGVEFIAGDFGDLGDLLDSRGISGVSGVLFDFGVSSHQLDEGSRGFSYRAAGPLDMRMDRSQRLTADDVVNSWSLRDIARVIRRFGEEPHADRIARAIVRARPIGDTVHLAQVVADAVPAAARRKPGHPARKTFQAIRIAVNDELGSIERGLDTAVRRLVAGGVCVAISYHSLEDRIVKRRFAEGARGCVCPPGLPVCGCGAAAELVLLTRRPLEASSAEVESNPRARSAKLRAARKVAA
ncbi:MAG: 16S rRNA (cytosine(1402)-N(4))-methyltransferase RsmH [Acidimicrobiia bacterium]|nr:16S rRNA (cytosine(1402)-N(4))-methyltransferase RsmH [Acidimicrobiia bacterium]MDH4307828.1 16S rRNA (cytosine(1402)-N(4))-methyltransferase RsmH [Acidimicrobiia bacterium]MDH5292807.1 16S rRNA (cytosine(1402)-N(4))-methyltransferase RsmH [Acidimicrobiia bacterium]